MGWRVKEIVELRRLEFCSFSLGEIHSAFIQMPIHHVADEREGLKITRFKTEVNVKSTAVLSTEP
jgi:hypothetical protein